MKLPALYRTRRFITVFTRILYCPLSWAICTTIFKNLFLILFPNPRLYLQSCRFPSALPIETTFLMWCISQLYIMPVMTAYLICMRFIPPRSCYGNVLPCVLPAAAPYYYVTRIHSVCRRRNTWRTYRGETDILPTHTHTHAHTHTHTHTHTH
jgi:hypothetical protein